MSLKTTFFRVSEVTQPSATSVLEALQQRRQWFQSGAEKAKQEQNAKKERRMTRLANTYVEAIAGKINSLKISNAKYSINEFKLRIDFF